jgi:hypothetical protein
MRRLSLVFVLILFSGVKSMAQNAPHVEIFGGYSHFLADISNTSFGLDGGEVAVTENLNQWFGGTLDFSGQWGTLNGFNVDTQQIMYGPVVACHKCRSFTPFAHVLLGAIRGSQEFNGISQSAFKFAAAFGGGIDIQVSQSFSIRAIQAEYLMSRFLETQQNNIRLSAGIVVKLGSAK